MFLSLSHELTEKSLLHDAMLRQCNFLTGRELEMHKLRMEYLAEEIQRVRDKINQITNDTNKKI